MPIERYEIIDYYTLTIAGSAVGFANATPAMEPHQPGQLFVGSLETQAIRVRMDGTDPTTTEGQLVSAGSPVEIDGPDIPAFKAIATTGTAVLKGHMYKYVGGRG